MKNLGHSPLVYTTEDEHRNQRYFLSGVFAFLFISFISLGLFIGIYYKEWWVFYFLGPISLLLGMLAVGFFPRQAEHFYKMTVYDDRLHQQWKQGNTKGIQERIIYFHEIEECLIGILSRKISGPKEAVVFRYHALLIINYKDGQFRQEILSKDELYEWRRRLYDKVNSIRYSKVDLGLYDEENINLQEIPSSDENLIGNFVGMERNKRFSLSNEE